MCLSRTVNETHFACFWDVNSFWAVYEITRNSELFRI